ncbi:MAG: class I SAM-dependent methyltransferase [Fimbriimonadaceae bacterium]|jgi:SAM-dependent methyltransferase|nr:class I SAM-dependent methyltransferase [Fimbriimonadaceae bacterium]
MSTKWDQYFEGAKGLPANPFYAKLRPFLPTTGHALDLGYGVGTGLLWWKELGWQVTGLDNDQFMEAQFLDSFGEIEGIRFVCGDFSEAPRGSYDCIAFVFSLFFQPSREAFLRSWEVIKENCAPGGLIAGQFLGPDDSWGVGDLTPPSPVVTHQREELLEMLSDFELLLLDEQNRTGKTLYGEPKRWHVYHIIAKKLN